MSFRPALLEHSCPDVLLSSHTHIIWDALLSYEHAASLHSTGGHPAHPPRDTLFVITPLVWRGWRGQGCKVSMGSDRPTLRAWFLCLPWGCTQGSAPLLLEIIALERREKQVEI